MFYKHALGPQKVHMAQIMESLILVRDSKELTEIFEGKTVGSSISAVHIPSPRVDACNWAISGAPLYSFTYCKELLLFYGSWYPRRLAAL